MRSTSFLMSWRALLASAPRRSSTVTTPWLSRAFPRDAFHPVDSADRLLHHEDDALFDLGGRGAGIGNGDAHHVEVEGGEDLLLDVRDEEEPAQEEHDHEKIGGHGVLGHPGDGTSGPPDDGAHRCVPFPPGSFSERMRSFMPGRGAATSLTTRRSPASRPCRTRTVAFRRQAMSTLRMTRRVFAVGDPHAIPLAQGEPGHLDDPIQHGTLEVDGHVGPHEQGRARGVALADRLHGAVTPPRGGGPVARAGSRSPSRRST